MGVLLKGGETLENGVQYLNEKTQPDMVGMVPVGNADAKIYANIWIE